MLDLQKRFKKQTVLCIILLLIGILAWGCKSPASSGENIEKSQEKSANFINTDELVITGTGLKEDVVLRKSDWIKFGNSKLIERFYSSNNRLGFHKIWKVRGFDLIDLLGKDNLKPGEDWTVTFLSEDKLDFTVSISDLRERYYYPQFTAESGEKVDPIIGIYRTAIFEPKYTGLPTEINWEDRELTEADIDDMAPRLYLGQKKGDPSYLNQAFFMNRLVRIIVGDERS